MMTGEEIINENIRAVQVNFFSSNIGIRNIIRDLIELNHDENNIEEAIKRFCKECWLDHDPEYFIRFWQLYKDEQRYHRIDLALTGPQSANSQKVSAKSLDDYPDPMSVQKFALYIGKSVQWCYNHTAILPKTQLGRKQRILFYKANVDKWLSKRLNKGAE
ncbi:hypothetical protein ACFL30_03165 [Candidatus Latescibacterota bacterium]